MSNRALRKLHGNDLIVPVEENEDSDDEVIETNKSKKNKLSNPFELVKFSSKSYKPIYECGSTRPWVNSA